MSNARTRHTVWLPQELWEWFERESAARFGRGRATNILIEEAMRSYQQRAARGSRKPIAASNADVAFLRRFVATIPPPRQSLVRSPSESPRADEPPEGSE